MSRKSFYLTSLMLLSLQGVAHGNTTKKTKFIIVNGTGKTQTFATSETPLLIDFSLPPRSYCLINNPHFTNNVAYISDDRFFVYMLNQYKASLEDDDRYNDYPTIPNYQYGRSVFLSLTWWDNSYIIRDIKDFYGYPDKSWLSSKDGGNRIFMNCTWSTDEEESFSYNWNNYLSVKDKLPFVGNITSCCKINEEGQTEGDYPILIGFSSPQTDLPQSINYPNISVIDVLHDFQHNKKRTNMECYNYGYRIIEA